MAMSARGPAHRSGRRAEGEERRDQLLYLPRSPAMTSVLSMRSNHAADLNKLQRVRKTGHGAMPRPFRPLLELLLAICMNFDGLSTTEIEIFSLGVIAW